MPKHELNALSDAIRESHHNRLIEQINDHCLRLAVMEDRTYDWHFHPNSDEVFLVTDGNLILEFQEEPAVSLMPGDAYKVPAGKIHRTIAKGRTVNLCFEATHAETVFVKTATDTH